MVRWWSLGGGGKENGVQQKSIEFFKNLKPRSDYPLPAIHTESSVHRRTCSQMAVITGCGVVTSVIRRSLGAAAADTTMQTRHAVPQVVAAMVVVVMVMVMVAQQSWYLWQSSEEGTFCGNLELVKQINSPERSFCLFLGSR
ncbi:hypothetical protein E2C01_020046 [Portunus trituberculatus]|uniref:Uncharacterized protein n=1 Tax=Portunus trituberculatus TaxID=210409 RepID=A0A5B7E098_PORTR|nr:hypothetical protein [Portunus trituberculatus]